jgi:5'-deoxynucleotidase YfbR-like HD superfamily hydrolase
LSAQARLRRTAEGGKADRPSELMRGPAGAPARKAGGAAREAAFAGAFRADGTIMDLAAPLASDIDFALMARRLGNLARWNGTPVPGYPLPISVAQHCVMGAEALLHEPGIGTAEQAREAAFYFLLHDGHEYLLGDITTPVVGAIDHHDRTALRSRGTAPDAVKLAKHIIDLAIWQAAGVARLDRQPRTAAIVADMDARMLRVEGMLLFGDRAGASLPAGERPPPRLRGALQPWPADNAARKFAGALKLLGGVEVTL